MVDNRIATGLIILESNFPQKKFHFLGEGKASVVFRDEHLVYKVFLLENYEALKYKRHIFNTIQLNKKKFDNSTFFYPITEIIELNNDCFILTYPFEKSEPCLGFEQSEIQEFLVECWQKRLVFQDIKPNNFVRVNKKLKWIDYEPDKFTDNLFLNMAVRAFLFVKYSNESVSFLNKLRRSAINNFDIPELKGLQSFMNDLFTRIIFQESQLALQTKQLDNNTFVNEGPEIRNEGNYSLPYQDSFNAEQLFWQLINKNIYLDEVGFDTPSIDERNYFSPKNIILKTQQIIEPKQKVSLVIKACIQDSEVLYESVKHIIRQLSFPNNFNEKILALDIRQTDFLREYNGKNIWQQLIETSQKLVDDLIIDKYIFPNENDVVRVNKKWFGIETSATHTVKKVPVSAQIFAFESTISEYVLQVDCDAMIGRLSKEHSFLNDMISELDANENVLSVGFNIYKGKENSFTPYFGFENGGFVPEVRFCLLKKSRFDHVLPLKNELVANAFELSWYRALEIRQKETETCSIRGGDSRSFFIHPQNFKKSDKDVWFTTIDRVEQLQIPEKQINEFDLAGSYHDWTSPKRNEDLVIISCFRNISLSRFLRYWYSLLSQTNQDWGLVLIDDASNNGISHFIKELIKPYQDRITFIENSFSVGAAQNTYKGIHYFTENQESVICILDADDALIGKNVLKNVFEKYSYFDADVVIGKMYRTDKLHAHYNYMPNFINPRLYGGNVWQHIRSFKKYLYDSLGFEDLKIKNQQQKTGDILLSRRFSQKMVFPEHCIDYSYMVPIIEMSSNPMWINHFNILHDRTTINTPEVKIRKNEIIDEILLKKSKSPKDVFFGRKTFLPNLKKIEIDITYECNLKCINCNRSSTQAPVKEGMTLLQIQEFVDDSIHLNKKWELINLLGGEPTIHIDFIEIVNTILYKYIIPYSPDTILQVTSNGFGDLVKSKLEQLPNHKNVIIDYASFKDERVVPYFSPFNDAPIDNESLSNQEFSKGCWVTSYCGIGLNQLGYYPCGVAGGIDRVFKKNLGVQKLEDVDESISKLLNEFCKYCGNFTDYAENQGNFIPRHEKAAIIKPKVSATWKKQYKIYNGKK
ncbi:glycosyltransferase [Olleya namhaensis]|uniref:glycosyltransferase n=1 Tax=Olleya namhaensis TaxID=1144750 RepID=UPI0023305A90|nr:glycosyltransferase [Olleya namhaensis]